MIYRNQPNILVNDRLSYYKDNCRDFDYYTPEICVPNQPQTVKGREVMWETCATMNDHWGYGDDIKTEEDFYRILGEEVAIMASLTNMCGWCYTLLTDVEQEQNGIYNYDRTTKVDTIRIRSIFSGVK